MELRPRRRRALSTLLAVILAAESVSAVAAAGATVHNRSAGTPPALLPGAVPSAAAVVQESALGVVTEIRRVSVRAQANAASLAAETGPRDEAGPRNAQEAAAARAKSEAAAKAKERAAARDRKARAKSRAKGSGDKATTKAHTTPKRSGRNHVWIPSLGINRSVAWFPCDRKRPPDNYVYRWGCAGSNNVYLLGHAYSVFKPLHDAYVRGRLRAGIKAYYADARGRVHTYRVRWWKVTAPTTAASWAWAALRRSSMTLQTCVGKNSAYRLMVRLVEVG
jgi:Sortase domain